jgi:hypothetical protein
MWDLCRVVGLAAVVAEPGCHQNVPALVTPKHARAKRNVEEPRMVRPSANRTVGPEMLDQMVEFGARDIGWMQTQSAQCRR